MDIQCGYLEFEFDVEVGNQRYGTGVAGSQIWNLIKDEDHAMELILKIQGLRVLLSSLVSSTIHPRCYLWPFFESDGKL